MSGSTPGARYRRWHPIGGYKNSGYGREMGFSVMREPNPGKECVGQRSLT